MRESYIFYASFYDAIKELEPDDKLRIYEAINQYALTGIMPQLNGIAKVVMSLIKPQIDANQRRFENGLKGGRPKAKPNDNQSQTKIEPNVNVNKNVNVDVNVNEKADVDDLTLRAKEETIRAERIKAVADYFNSQCHKLPKIQELTNLRKNTINARLNDINGRANLKMVIDKTAKSNFLNGKNDRGWKANFDWILKQTNYTKIIEGTYDNDNEPKSTTAAGRTTARNEAEAIKRTERAELEGLAAAILSGAAGGQS